jgi:hypothetical protein
MIYKDLLNQLNQIHERNSFFFYFNKWTNEQYRSGQHHSCVKSTVTFFFFLFRSSTTIINRYFFSYQFWSINIFFFLYLITLRSQINELTIFFLHNRNSFILIMEKSWNWRNLNKIISNTILEWGKYLEEFILHVELFIYLNRISDVHVAIKVGSEIIIRIKTCCSNLWFGF